MNSIDEKMKQDIRKAILELKESKDISLTYWFTFEIDDYLRRWAIVLAWQDGYAEENTDWHFGEYRITMKVAFQPTNSIMHEYDIDWTMPWDEETGDVDDSEVSIHSDAEIDSVIDYMFKIWETYKKEYIDKEYLKW